MLLQYYTNFYQNIIKQTYDIEDIRTTNFFITFHFDNRYHQYVCIFKELFQIESNPKGCKQYDLIEHTQFLNKCWQKTEGLEISEELNVNYALRRVGIIRQDVYLLPDQTNYLSLNKACIVNKQGKLILKRDRQHHLVKEV